MGSLPELTGGGGRQVAPYSGVQGAPPYERAGLDLAPSQDRASPGQYVPGPVASAAPRLSTASAQLASVQPSSKMGSVDLDSMSIEQLKQLLEERDREAIALEKEVGALRQYQPSAQEERLQRLEWLIGKVQPGDTVKMKAPMLKEIRKLLHDQHTKEHKESLNAWMEAMQDECHLEVSAHPEYERPDPKSFVLKRGYVPLDRTAIAKADEAKERERDKHPAVRELHYAGHMSRRAEEVGVAFVKDGHVLERRPIWPTANHHDFWLSLDGHSRSEHEQNQEANRKMSQDAIAQRAFQYDTPGVGEDFYAVDWLGKMKRGDYWEEDHNHERWSGPLGNVAKLFVP